MFNKILLLLTILAISAAGCGGKTPAREDAPAAESAEEAHEEAAEEEKEAEEAVPEAAPAEEEENSHDLVLQTLGGEDIARIEVPAFLPYTEHAPSYVKASDDGTHDVSYMHYGAWDKEQFFAEVVNTDAYTGNESFSNVAESEMQTAEISGKTTECKKITALYDGEIALVQYGAVIDVEGGVLGVNMYVYGEEDADEAFFSVLKGINLK